MVVLCYNEIKKLLFLLKIVSDPRLLNVIPDYIIIHDCIVLACMKKMGKSCM